MFQVVLRSDVHTAIQGRRGSSCKGCDMRAMKFHVCCTRQECYEKDIRWVMVMGASSSHYPPPPLCNSYALVQATAGVGTVFIWYLI